MPKICEICKQPYDDKLTSCPNCDIVDIFSAPTPPPGPEALHGVHPEDVDLGGEVLSTVTDPHLAKPSGSKPPSGDMPTTRVQGPLPPMGASVAAQSMAQKKPTTPPQVSPPPTSPLMKRAMDTPKGPQPPQGEGKATQLPAGAGQPTMVAPQSGKPTLVAPQGGKPTQVAPQGGKPTMVAPEGQMPVSGGAPPSGQRVPTPARGTPAATPPRGSAPAGTPPRGTTPAPKPPTAATPPKGVAPAKAAQPTMIPKGAAQPTMLAKGSKPPTMLMPPGEVPLDVPGGAPGAGPKKTMVPQGAKMPTQLAKRGEKTQLAPEGEAPLDVPGSEAPTPQDPKKTQLPKGAAMPTMLAKGGTPTSLAPEGEAPLEIPGQDAASPKKTMVARGGTPTTLTPEGTAPLAPPGQTGLSMSNVPPTMLAKTAPPTYLAPEGSAPMELPEGAAPAASPKKTMLQKPPAPTSLAPEGTEPLDLPAGAASPLKKTQLPQGVRQPTILAPPEEATAMEYPDGGGPPKKTQLPHGARQPTILAPPEEARAMEIPGQTGMYPTTLSGEVARESLEATGMMTDAGMDSASKYDTAAVAAVAPAPPAVKPHYKRRWLGGIILGLLLAAGILFGLWSFRNDEPVLGWLKAVGLRPDTLDSPTPLTDAMAKYYNGDYADVFRLIPEDKFTDKPDYYALRGAARWWSYLQDCKVNNKPLDKDAGEVKRAREELLDAKQKGIETAALRPELDLTLGSMAEFLTPDDAVKVYAEGAKANKPQEAYFEAGINRVEVLSTVKPAAKGGAPKEDTVKPKEDGKEKAKNDQGAMRHMTEKEALEVLALILTAQQGGQAAQAPPEAGVKFWEAYKAMQKGDYPTALKTLKEARDVHDKQRFVRLRKPQNPYSDPTEEIFLRAADDLNMYWQVRQALQKNGYDLAKMSPVDAVDRMHLATTKPDAALQMIAKELGVEPKIDDIIKTIQGLGEDKKIAGAVRKALVDGKYVDDDNKDVVKATDALIDDSKTKQKIAKAAADAGEKDKDTYKAVENLIKYKETFTKAADKLAKAKYIEPNPNHEQFLAGIDLAIEAATSPLVAALGRALSGLAKVGANTPIMGAPSADLAAQLALAKLENEVLRGREKMVRTPREMLEFWLPALKNPEQKEIKDVVAQATVDAKRVLDDKLLTANDKAAANTVQAMANRITGNFDAARTDLAEAVKAGRVVKEGNWRKYATVTSRDLSDPTAYYLPRGEELQTIGQYPQALDVLNNGVGAFPKDGRVLALRSQVRLDLARNQAKARLTLRDPLVAEARKDAEAAVAAGTAGEGSYALGRVYEDVGDAVTAEQHYRRALQANPGANRAGSRYRVALGRVLLKLNPLPGQPVPAVPANGQPPAPAPRRVGKVMPTSEQDMRIQLVLVLTGVIGPDDADETPELDEIIRLAEQAIRAGNYEGYLVKARALARKGMWTQALKTYDLGLRYLIKPEYSQGLSEIVNNHPAFNLPDPLRNPDPLRAERHYGAGLRLYYAGQYQAAEREFLEAYRNQGQDARILYYLGLSRLPQSGKRSAAVVNFQMGAILEQQNKPSPAAINSSLERVQGDLRGYIGRYRP